MTGKVKIELTDVNTGKKIEREDHNIVTNAVADLMQCWVTGSKVVNDMVTPAATKALGGLMLFDSSLSSVATNTEFPRTAHLKGYALQSLSSDTLCGSLDSSASGKISGGYRCVWNFAQNQCNGTIASLARTYNASPIHRLTSNLTCSHTIVNGTSGYAFPVCYDESTEYMYGYKFNSATAIGIYRQKQPMMKYGVCEYAGECIGTPELVKTVTISNLHQTGFFVKNYDGYLYQARVASSSTPLDTFTYQRIKYSDMSFEAESPVTVTCSGLQFYNSNQGQDVCITGNKALVLGNNKRYLYLIDLTDTTSVVTIDAGSGNIFYYCNSANGDTQNYSSTTNGNGAFTAVKCIGTSAATGTFNTRPVLIYEDGTTTEGTSTESWIYYDFKVFPTWKVYKQLCSITNIRSYNYNGNLSYDVYALRNYLGTICNLASPVVKTNTQTMKITYDLMDA